MQKTLVRIIAALCIFTLIPIFSSCNSENKNSNNTQSSSYHTITFDTKGGSKIADITVKHGSFAKEPSPPTLENYVFCRWQTSQGRAFFFDIYYVEEDLELEAIWIKADDLFELAAMPDSNGIMITDIKRQEDFDVLYVPKIINGKTVEGIGTNAFKKTSTSHASTIVFPDTVRYVESSAFAGISEVNIILGGTLTHIEESSFDGTIHISSIKLGVGITAIPYRSFWSCSSLKSINIPEGVTVIQENAFELCENLTTIVLPSTLTTIENSAFEECSSLKTVFFCGTQEQYFTVSSALGNESISNATIYFYSEEQPSQDGYFWHYDKNSTPTIW